MKTSNKLLIAAILIIIVSMITYDLALRVEYKKGTYKSRFYGFEKLGFKNFSKIDNRVANQVSIQINQSPEFEVFIKKELKDQIKIIQHEDLLIIDVLDRKTFRYGGDNGVVIMCPSVERLVTTPFFKNKNEEKAAEGYFISGSNTLVGFNQKNVDLCINKATHVFLIDSKIESLKAIVGNSTTKNAMLSLVGNTFIKSASITVAGTNSLEIQNKATIIKKVFNISDSAHVNLTGSFVTHLIK